jgi:hypothetical protein
MTALYYIEQYSAEEIFGYYLAYMLYTGSLLYILRKEKFGYFIILCALILPIAILAPIYPGLIISLLVGMIFKPDISPPSLFLLSFAFTIICFFIYRKINISNKTIRDYIKDFLSEIKDYYFEYNLEFLISKKTLDDAASSLFYRLRSGRENKDIRVAGFIILYLIAYFYIGWIDYFSGYYIYKDLYVIFKHSNIIGILLFFISIYFYLKYYDYTENKMYSKFLAISILLIERGQSVIMIDYGNLLVIKNTDLPHQEEPSRYYQFRNYKFRELGAFEKVYEINKIVDYDHFKQAYSRIKIVGVKGYFSEIAAMISALKENKN